MNFPKMTSLRVNNIEEFKEKNKNLISPDKHDAMINRKNIFQNDNLAKKLEAE